MVAIPRLLEYVNVHERIYNGGSAHRPLGDDARIVAIVITNTRRGNSPYLLPRETIECGESQKPSVPPTVKLKPATDCEALPAADVLMTR